MTPWMLYGAAAAIMTVVGFVGTFDADTPVRRILALNVTSTGVFLILVASARRASPFFADPVPHALVLTGVVVSVSAMALALALAERMAHSRDDADTPPDDEREP
ncbi:MAG TPA: NADH-quinone oxidoreductase subunit K [Labilithrix sp.]|nr:NADH-quinone oxidoreductase subunit K [Labilithrix sp.]